jgi:hypothetical protein
MTNNRRARIFPNAYKKGMEETPYGVTTNAHAASMAPLVSRTKCCPVFNHAPVKT